MLAAGGRASRRRRGLSVRGSRVSGAILPRGGHAFRSRGAVSRWSQWDRRLERSESVIGCCGPGADEGRSPRREGVLGDGAVLFALHDLVGQLPAVMFVLVGPVDEILPLGGVKEAHDGGIPLPVEVELGQDRASLLPTTGLGMRGGSRKEEAAGSAEAISRSPKIRLAQFRSS